MPRPSLFSFSKITSLPPQEDKYFVTVKTNGAVTFQPKWVQKFGFNNELVEVVADGVKRVIGFRRILTQDAQELETVKAAMPDSKVISINSAGTCVVGIGSIVKNLPWYKPEEDKRLELHHYEVKAFGPGKSSTDVWYFDPNGENHMKKRGSKVEKAETTHAEG